MDTKKSDLSVVSAAALPNPIRIFKPSDGDCKRRRRRAIYEKEVSIMDFPTVIMVEIVSRLSIKDIFRCKCVNKCWYNLSSDPLFAKLYHSRSHPLPWILLLVTSSKASLLELKSDYDCPENTRIMLSPEFHFPPRKPGMVGLKWSNFEIIDSCNGFICLSYGPSYDKKHSVYIINPLLGEYCKLKLPQLGVREVNVAYRFCFSEASGQYKVLRSALRTFRFRSDISELKVYTLGVDERWRTIGDVPHPLPGFKVNVNGAHHWMSKDNPENRAKVYSFDIGTEEVQDLPIPPCLEGELLNMTLGELRNCLCLTNHVYGEHVDIWLMKEYGIAESWTKGRILIHSIPSDIHHAYFTPKVIWKDGEILMQCQFKSDTQLVSYNPKEKKFRKVNVNSGESANFIIHRYIPCFYSLKTVMGDNFQA